MEERSAQTPTTENKCNKKKVMIITIIALLSVALGVMTTLYICKSIKFGEKEDQLKSAQKELDKVKSELENSTNGADDDSDNDPSTEDSGSNSQDNTDGYLVIDDWGVKFRIPSGLNDVNWAYSPVSYNSIAISANGYSSNEMDQNHCALGVITKSASRTTEGPAGWETSFARIGNYYFYYSSPQSACGDDESTFANQGKTTRLIKTMIESIQAAN